MTKRFTTALDPDFLRDPHPYLADLRSNAPVFRDEQTGAWIITRHQDVKQVLADPRVSRELRHNPFHSPAEPGTWVSRFEQGVMLFAAPAQHRRSRKQLSAGFTPRAVRRMEEQVRSVVRQFTAALVGRRGEVDVSEEFTNPIPLTVISRITGIPPYPGDEDRFRKLAHDVTRIALPLADDENKRRGERAIEELAEWIGKLADDRRQQPADDLLSDLIVENRGGDAISDEEVIVQILTLVAAGSDTTTMGGTIAIRLLLEHSEELARLRNDPSLARGAAREALRFDFVGPVGFPAVATEDLEVAGVQIRSGDVVMASTMSANRDPSVFENPDRFDITRDNRQALTFGNGPHHCLGANLAIQELGLMLQGVLDFLPEHARLTSETEWETIGPVRRPGKLVIDFG